MVYARPEPVNKNLEPGSIYKNLGPGLVNTNWLPGPVNTDWRPGSVNINRVLGLGAWARAGVREIQRPAWSVFLILSIARFLRAPILKSICERLLLKICPETEKLRKIKIVT